MNKAIESSFQYLIKKFIHITFEYKALIAVNIFIALMSSLLFIEYFTPTWKASAVIKIGKIGLENSPYFYSPESVEHIISRFHKTALVETILKNMKLSETDFNLMKKYLRIETISRNAIQLTISDLPPII